MPNDELYSNALGSYSPQQAPNFGFNSYLRNFAVGDAAIENGNVCFIDLTNTAYRARADSAANCSGILGIALGPNPGVGQPMTFLALGYYNNSYGFIPGQAVYLSDSVWGGLQQNAPTNPNSVTRSVGYTPSYGILSFNLGGLGVMPGPTGAAGATGATGATGPGVAAGGTTGQVLKKNSSTNYDTGWESLTYSLLGGSQPAQGGDGDLQFNSASQMAGASGLTWDGANLTDTGGFFCSVFAGSGDTQEFLFYDNLGNLTLGDVNNAYGGVKLVIAEGGNYSANAPFYFNQSGDDGSGSLLQITHTSGGPYGAGAFMSGTGQSAAWELWDAGNGTVAFENNSGGCFAFVSADNLAATFQNSGWSDTLFQITCGLTGDSMYLGLRGSGDGNAFVQGGSTSQVDIGDGLGTWHQLNCGNMNASGFIRGSSLSTSGGTNYWTLGGYTSGAPSATGYVTISLNGVTRKLLSA